MTEVTEVIRRLSDTDGDGTLDDSKVFADGFNDVLDGTAAGVFYYDGCLYFACIPKIYKLRDTDGDGVSDERNVVEEGIRCPYFSFWPRYEWLHPGPGRSHLRHDR